MQAISDELLEILASRLQAGTRGYGCRVEIDYLIPGSTEIGEEVDLNPLLGTVTGYTRGTASAMPDNPTYANDGNVLTAAGMGVGGAGGALYPIRGIDADLGTPATVSHFAVHQKATNGPRFQDVLGATMGVGSYGSRIQYWDGAAWADIAGSLTSNPSGTSIFVYTFTSPVTAQQFRLEFGGKQANGIWGGVGIIEWGILGTLESTVPGTLGTTGYQVSSCSIDKSRRMTAGQAEIEIPLGDDTPEVLVPGGPIATNAPLRIYQWYGDPSDEVLVFTGSIDEIREGRDPRTIRIVSRDMMKRLIVQTFGAIAPQGADEDDNDRTPANGVYLNMDVDDIVNDILDRAGVPDDMRSVAATSYGLDEYVIPDGASWAEAIIGDDALTGLTGYDLWADEAGIIHFESALSNRATDSDTDPTPDYSYVIGAAA